MNWHRSLLSGRPDGPPGLLRNFIDGGYVDGGGKTFPKVSPVTG